VVWQPASEGGWLLGAGMRGHRISVQLERAAGRELILQYPSPDPLDARDHPTVPERPKIVAEAVEADIRRAVAAGWDPLSRGRPRTMLVADLPA
jgi:hypothetical protein